VKKTENCAAGIEKVFGLNRENHPKYLMIIHLDFGCFRQQITKSCSAVLNGKG
jgi:hypothetical protein